MKVTPFLFSFSRFLLHGILLNRLIEVVILCLMAVSAIYAYRQLSKMDYNYHRRSLLDDLLLFICIPAFFVSAIFSIVPAVEYRSAVGIALIIAQVLTIAELWLERIIIEIYR